YDLSLHDALPISCACLTTLSFLANSKIAAITKNSDVTKVTNNGAAITAAISNKIPDKIRRFIFNKPSSAIINGNARYKATAHTLQSESIVISITVCGSIACKSTFDH